MEWASHVQAAVKRKGGAMRATRCSFVGWYGSKGTMDEKGVCRIAKYSVRIPFIRAMYSCTDSSEPRPVDFSYSSRG